MNEAKIKSFTDLKVWQEAYALTILVYKITKKFPKDYVKLVEKANLTHQLLQGFIQKTKSFIK